MFRVTADRGPENILEAALEKQRYEMVVIGSGAGGLLVAALLADAGYKTLVVEKLPAIGGRASSFRYRGFTMSTGAHWVETGGIVEGIFRQVGAEFDVVPLVTGTVMRIGGRDYPMTEKGGLRALMLMLSNQAETDRVMAAIRKAMFWKDPSDRTPVRDWLLRYTNDENILAIFKSVVQYQCVNFHEMPAGEFFRQMRNFRGVAAGYPRKGILEMWRQLVKVVEAKGGAVLTRCSAKRILVEDETVRGVVIERGGAEQSVPARAVISDIGPHGTVSLAGRKNFESGYLKDLAANVVPLSIMYASVASDKPLVDFRNYLQLPEGRRGTMLIGTTASHPDVAPPGKHLLEAWSVPSCSFMPILRPDEELGLLVQDLRDNIAGFDDHANVLHTSCWQGDWPMYRALPGFPQKTPVENLYNVGDGVAPHMQLGVVGCAGSARIVFEDIKQRMNPEHGA